MIRTIHGSITSLAVVLSALGAARAGDPPLPPAKEASFPPAAQEELKRTIEEMRDDVRELRQDVAKLRQALESGDTSSPAHRKMFAELVEEYNKLVKQDRWAEAELVAKQAKELERANLQSMTQPMSRAVVAMLMYEKARLGRQVYRNADRTASDLRPTHLKYLESLAVAAGTTKGGQSVDQPDPGQADELRLHFQLPQGMTWPAGVLPEVYPESLRDKARLAWQPMNRRNGRSDPYSAGVRSIGPDTFAVRLSHPREPFYVAVFAPGFLRFFERGSFKMSEIKNGVLEIAIEKPGLLDVHFDAGTAKPETLPFDGQWVTVWRRKSKTPGDHLWVCQHLELPQGKPLQFTDLAAGDYLVAVGTRAKPGVKAIDKPTQTPINPGEFRDYKQPTLLAGQTCRIDIHYVPLDLQAYRAHRSAVIRITKPDGKPATGSRVSIGYFDGHYGRVPVFLGPLPATGEITLRDITDRVPDNSWALHGYSVWVEGRAIGKFEFQTKSALETFTFQVPPDVGDMAPDVELVSVATGKRSKLSSLRGKLVCLDFWLTWCEYCQDPMRSLDQAAAKNRWKDRIAIVPVSFDEKVQSVAPFVNERGWNHLQHYWAGPWKSGPLDAPAAQAFVCDAIPVAILIGPDGRILWRGHPLAKVSGKDIADRIDEMLKPHGNAEQSAKSSGSAAVE